ncbi:MULTISPECIES: hypothetical protein [unclassified Tenacibaculum]|uniref:hypothetical protein n=1 Tax=unclassified Tenacibaculum TaxID=2635139 RepID=UPI001F44EDA7|nr:MULTISPECIES: hypothetical protein [unclassified Tenacibaculum]MCF2873239.1 hypothetical protein [Tenacibaculum sp. Cn5-1]MCF2933395.1 hypothetical protein [Tenacibaculum sp. Cn5-34]MCG7510024.1 hypothetical protein [Tenacibaculum sp. Cn5-46]
MTQIIKSSWKWDIKENSFGINLGDDIADLISRNIIRKNASNEYESVNEQVWSVGETNGKVTSIAFRRSFFEFIRDDLWELEYTKFESELNSKLTKVNDEFKGDSLHVVFRGNFIAIAILKRT